MIGGSLLTEFFLREGMAATSEWQALDAAEVADAARDLHRLWQALAAMANPNEATTEAAFIFPVLTHLGWHFLPQQAAGGGRRDIPDALLFRTGADRARAAALRTPADRYPLAAVVVENEARDTPLDRGSGRSGTPASQILRYLALAEPASGGAVRWGLLTNGRLWRLYFHGARSRAEGFIGFDLPALLNGVAMGDAAALDLFRAFLLLFRRAAHDPTGPGGQTFLDAALAEGRRYEQRITAALSEAVFDRVFPRLVTALAAADPTAAPADPRWRAEVRQAALILLYRLLFVLYAEDRDLLPIRHPGYAAYALRRLRAEAAEVRDRARPVSATLTRWWDDLAALCRAIDAGDASLGLPPYNGGLFTPQAAPLLGRVRLPDATMAELLDDLSREGEAGARRLINFRDLSVQHLGSIYERLLEFDVVQQGTGLALRPNPFARKTSGSYYTPEELVRLIIRRAVGPLLDERRARFRAEAERLAHDRRPREQRLAELRRHDPAEAFLSLRVLDPAMGSGHFLVSLVDWLTDETLAAQQEAAALVTWAEYASPLAATIERIRAHIREQAAAHGWEVREDQLDDRHLVRRIVLKRVIYGADLNPMAVELAKLSLWLHSFTVGAPLSFLDHHLRTGDSLFGEFVHQAEERIAKRGALLIGQAVVQARNAAKGMAIVESLTDADIAEVRQSAATFGGVEEATRPLARFLDLIHAARWLEPDLPDSERRALDYLLDGVLGDPVKIAAGEAPVGGPPGTRQGAERVLAKARALAEERRFQHWEVAFPGVWEDWESARPRGGFDAVIGNPPWDRIKLQEVEWFAARAPEVAKQQRAADRKKMVAALRKKGGELARDYERAAWAAEAAARVARACGAYPLLSGGDANLYALFVERALRLVRPEGIVGLLVPSGIAADKNAAAFFRSVATTGRLGALFDFENRRTRLGLDPFFPDVDSRFKFSALIVGGEQRKFDTAACAFFAQSAAEAEGQALALTPEDFAAVNPNTGTAPVFRSARDAEITLDIYRRLPVLVDHRTKPPARFWPVRYFTMFHMTSDSGKFRTEAELAALGAYRVAPNRWKRGDEEWVPLYEGKMVQAFDHRAASVVVNPENLNRPAQPEPATDEQHADPNWLPNPQFWVSLSDIDWPQGPRWALAFKDITSPTNARTMIAAAVPFAAFGNKLPLLLPDLPEEPRQTGARRERWRAECDAILATYRRGAPLLLANLNALPLDYIARQKVQGTTLNLYILEQFPILPLDTFARPIGATTAEAIARDHVLRLTYTAHDMKPFAEDMGHTGPPFPWDAEERLHLRARLDALFFLLYGLDRDAAAYILGTFPIVREEEEHAFGGRFRSRDLILGYMAAFAAGDPETRIAA